MEKYLRYKGEFFSIAGVLWRAEIWQDAEEKYATIGRLDFSADDPLVIEWGETDKLEPVQSSKATLTVVSRVDRQYKDLYTVDTGSIRMDVYRDNILYWSGTLDTELYEEPFSYEKEYEVTLTFSDFAVLDRLKFQEDGFLTLLELFQKALHNSFINIRGIQQYISTSRAGDTSSETLLSHTCINCGNFYDEDGEPMTWRTVLDETLRPFAMRMIQRSGDVFIYDLNAIQDTFEPELIHWEGKDAVLGVDAVYKSAKVSFSPYDKTELMKQEVITEGLSPFATDLLVRTDYSVGSDDLMNASEGFYMDLFQSVPAPKGLFIHKHAMLFKIDPVFSNYEGEGVAWIVKIRANQYGLYNTIVNNSLFTNYETLIKIDKKIDVPNVLSSVSYGKKRQRLLRLKMGVLLDVRYNPFETSGDYNEQGDYEKMRTKIRCVHIPFRMRIRNAEGIVVKHYANVSYDKKIGVSYGGKQRWVDGDYPETNKPNRPYAVLSYYTPPREDKLTKAEYPGGWMENHQCVQYPHFSLCHLYDIMGAGEYIFIPKNVQGTIEVEIGTGIFNQGSSGYYNSDIAQHPVFDGFAEKVRWLLYKTPTLDIVDGYGKEIETKDIEYSSWVNTSAKEDLDIDTFLGNSGDLKVCGLGILLRKEDYNPVVKFSRAGVTDYIEKLLMGTVYSQYSHRMNMLTGTVRLLNDFGLYTDLSEPGNYMIVSDVQHVITEESEVKLVQVEPDYFEGIDYEKTI